MRHAGEKSQKVGRRDEFKLYGTRIATLVPRRYNVRTSISCAESHPQFTDDGDKKDWMASCFEY